MATITIEKKWHKVNDRIAMNYAQLELISGLRNDVNCPDWPFASKTNAMRSLTKEDASEIIYILKTGDKVVFV